MRIGDDEISNQVGLWYVDNVFRGGEMILGEYVLLRRDTPIDTQIATGHDPYELLKIADQLNAAEDREAA